MFARIFLLSCLCGAAAAAGDKIDYGGDEVNSLAPTAGTQVTGAEDYDYLALRNHIGSSGVPLGGIGVGYFCYCPDGRFTRVSIYGWHDEGHCELPPIIKNTRGTFLALWADGQARLLQRGEYVENYLRYSGLLVAIPASRT